MTALLMMLTVVIMAAHDPEHAPPGEKFSWAERLQALKGIWGVLLLVLVVLVRQLELLMPVQVMDLLHQEMDHLQEKTPDLVEEVGEVI